MTAIPPATARPTIEPVPKPEDLSSSPSSGAVEEELLGAEDVAEPVIVIVTSTPLEVVSETGKDEDDWVGVAEGVVLDDKDVGVVEELEAEDAEETLLVEETDDDEDTDDDDEEELEELEEEEELDFVGSAGSFGSGVCLAKRFAETWRERQARTSQDRRISEVYRKKE